MKDFRECNDPLKIRREWMAMAGLTVEEIDEECELDPPGNLDEELAEYNAMLEIERINKIREPTD